MSRALCFKPAVTAVVLLTSCQNYPFVFRESLRSEARRINEVVATVAPADILFIIDNSGSMQEEVQELRNNVSLFAEELSRSDIDFQVGFITTDVECNVPNRDCAGGTASAACCATATTLCEDRDLNNDGVVEFSSCDAGRLRSADGFRRIFGRPSEAERSDWIDEVEQVLNEVGCEGSGFEAGLEAAVRAVGCSVGDPTCGEQAVADLNQGFIRDDADLVLVFLSDEDDCSTRDALAYQQPNNPSDPAEQAFRLCGPDACYATYGADLDLNSNNLNDFVDPALGGPIRCLGATRSVNPPLLTSVEAYLDELVMLKGGDVTKIRTAAIVGGISSAVATTATGFEALGCWDSGVTPSSDCGCWSTTGSTLYCDVTEVLGQFETRVPTTNTTPQTCGGGGGPSPGGCEAMPGGRFNDFLNELAIRRQEAGARPDILVDSICRSQYDATIFGIVNSVILTNCFNLGMSPAEATDIDVRLNGVTLGNVAVGAETPGWSWLEGSSQICLEGGLSKTIGDSFEILVLSADE